MDNFELNARELLARAGGDPANAGPLAQWGRTLRRECPGNRADRGVIVAEDGTLIAETRRRGWKGGHGAAQYVSARLDGGNTEVVNVEYGLAQGRINQEVGTNTIHVTYWEVGKTPYPNQEVG